MVGHDIRNPLQSIISDIYLANCELDLLPPSEQKNNIKESLSEITQAVDYVNKIVVDLQDFVRPIKPVFREIDLRPLIEELMLKTYMPNNIAFSLEIDKKIKKITLDHALLSRILANLINNAIQAMPKGGELKILVVKVENGVSIIVQDTGMGIPKGIEDKLFTPLFTTKAKGQGFGLAVVKRLTEMMNGTVSFESQVGKGTKFILNFSLPLSE